MDDNSLIWIESIFSSGFFLPALILFAVICFVVFIHELGHYLTARLFGVRIRKFSIGFGREIRGFTDRNNTRWSWSLWPLGGYVELFGYDSAPEPTLWDHDLQARRPYSEQEKSVAFCYKPLWQRTLIVAMGPMANFILAVLILMCVYSIYGERSTRPIINGVGQSSVAYAAGLMPGDEILEKDGIPVRRFEDIWDQSYNSPESMLWKIRRDDRVIDVRITPEKIAYEDKKGIGRSHGRIGAVGFGHLRLDKLLSVNGIAVKDEPEKAKALLRERLDGIVRLEIEIYKGKNEIFLTRPLRSMNDGLFDDSHAHAAHIVVSHNDEAYYLQLGIGEAFTKSLKRLYKFFDESLKFLHAAFFKNSGDEKIGGLVTMGKITSNAVDAGWYTLIMLVVVFSVQIGFINLLPIPVLDGGYLLFFAYEALAGKPLPARVQDYALSIGLVLLIGIMLLANISDILRLGG